MKTEPFAALAAKAKADPARRARIAEYRRAIDRPRTPPVDAAEWARLRRIEAAARAVVHASHEPGITGLALAARWDELEAAVDAPQAPTTAEGEHA